MINSEQIRDQFFYWPLTWVVLSFALLVSSISGGSIGERDRRKGEKKNYKKTKIQFSAAYCKFSDRIKLL